MRKILIILTLMVSSFFICNSNVKADTTTHIIDEKDFALLTDEFYALREKTIEYCEINNKYYIISYTATDGLRANIFNIGTYYYQTVAYGGINFPRIQILNVTVTSYKLNEDALSKTGTNSSYNKILRDTTYENYFSYALYLDTNIELLSTTSTDFTYSFTYNDFIYTPVSTEHFLSLYELYVLMNTEEEVQIDNKEVVDSFYAIVIDRIIYLATSFSNNYIYLSIISIFILIFVIELIFRRFL